MWTLCSGVAREGGTVSLLEGDVPLLQIIPGGGAKRSQMAQFYLPWRKWNKRAQDWQDIIRMNVWIQWMNSIVWIQCMTLRAVHTVWFSTSSNPILFWACGPTMKCKSRSEWAGKEFAAIFCDFSSNHSYSELPQIILVIHHSPLYAGGSRGCLHWKSQRESALIPF